MGLGEGILSTFQVSEPADNSWEVLRTGTCADLCFCRIPLAALGEMSLGEVISEAERWVRRLLLNSTRRLELDAWVERKDRSKTIMETEWTRPGQGVIDTKETGSQIEFQVFYFPDRWLMIPIRPQTLKDNLFYRLSHIGADIFRLCSAAWNVNCVILASCSNVGIRW